MTKYHLSNWMSMISDDTPICDLLIPGTHDTMTATCDQRYYKTQNLSLDEQLQCGVRFFDMRIRREMIAAHREWHSNITMNEIMSTLKDFLEKYPSEVIIMRVQNANELKDDYPNITLEAAIPCRSQADRWNIVSKKRYNRLLLLCDKVTYVNEAYTKNCMMERNIYMIDNSDYVVAVWNGKPSGTGKTVEYAVNCGKDVFYVDPNTFLMKNIKF